MKYFKLEEMLRSDTAQKYNISNIPNQAKTRNIFVTLAMLDLIREKWGKPIIVTSGYRSRQLNAKVGGAVNSYHLQGRAADIKQATLAETIKLWTFIRKHKSELPIQPVEMILEKTWIHIAF